MRTYSHAVLTYLIYRAFRRLGAPTATAASLGAVLPDLPAIAGAAWLAASLCPARGDGGGPSRARLPRTRVDANRPALLPARLGRPRSRGRPHARKRRPPLCPVSSYRFESDISYRERYRHHALPFTIAEPAAVLVARETTTGAANTYHRSARAALKPTHSPCSSVHSAPGPTVNNNPPPA